MQRLRFVVGGIFIVAVGGLMIAAPSSSAPEPHIAATNDALSHALFGLADVGWWPQPQAVLEQQLLRLRSVSESAMADIGQPTKLRPDRNRQTGLPTANETASIALHPVSSAAQAAVEFALAQRGKPYLWGGTGPATFDCSGLTQQAYRHAGVSIPRTSRQQARIGTPVRLIDLQPGDLLFYAYNARDMATIHHVTMYVGAGQVIHSPQAGDRVKLSQIWLTEYVGAVRPIAAPLGHEPDSGRFPTAGPSKATTDRITTNPTLTPTEPSTTAPPTAAQPSVTTVPTSTTPPSTTIEPDPTGEPIPAIQPTGTAIPTDSTTQAAPPTTVPTGSSPTAEPIPPAAPTSTTAPTVTIERSTVVAPSGTAEPSPTP